MSGPKKPVFGVLSLSLMVGLIIAGVLVTAYVAPPAPAISGESLAVAVGAAANIIATVTVIIIVSLTSLILAGISLMRRERRWPAAIGLTLSLSALVMVVFAAIQL